MARNSFSHTSDHQRHTEDWYVEPRFTVEQLLDEESFEGEVLDPCCGGGTIVSVCQSRGISAGGSDIVDRGFRGNFEVRDLFSITEPVDNIISNVPYGIAEACARHMLGIARRKVALILRMPFWESRTSRNSRRIRGIRAATVLRRLRASRPAITMNMAP
jgi:hypothetical protein